MSDTTESTSAPSSECEDPTDRLVTTEHVLSLPEGELAYTATTGRIVLRDEIVEDDIFRGWKAKAELSITAYTLKDTDATTRPVTFVFNGGPGSSSIWLHMGLLGPRLVDMGEVETLTAPPYALVDNQHTLLRDSDLVFIDPMSTGHSRAAEGHKAKDFHGWKADVEQVSELIRLWCTREDRWMSPKYLLGESYGTTRAVSTAERLWSQHGMAFNGLVLISSVLDFGNQDFSYHQIDEACLSFLPSYAAIAWYHGKHPGRELADVRREAEEFAAGRYRMALAQGSRLDPGERADVAATLARLTGLSVEYVERAHLRVEHIRFCTELLRDRLLSVGRIDGRFTQPLDFGNAEMRESDASIDAMIGPYTAGLHHYLRSELNSDQDLAYEVFGNAISEWSFKEFEARPIDVTDKLERLMRVNPHLRVRVEYGYFDLATPYHAAEHTVAHLRINEQARDRIEHAYFETGHMPYLHGDSRVAEAEGIAAFVRGESAED